MSNQSIGGYTHGGEHSPGGVDSLAGYVRGFKLTTFTASGTYTPNARLVYAEIELLGPGGGGGGADNDGAAGGGGGSGGYWRHTMTRSELGASVAVTIGTGGAGGSNTGGNGGNGSADSVFGSFATCGAGSGGNGETGAVNGPGGAGGSVTASIGLQIDGQHGQDGLGVTTNPVGGDGGSTILGTGGKGGVSDGTGHPATGYGAGGGGAAENDVTGRAGGDGKAGICIIREFLG